MLEGGCLCGQARYTISAEPLMSGVCHCKNCQRQAGSAYSVLIAVPKAAVEQSGDLTIYEDTAESGKPVFRHFCGTCGSPLFSLVPDAPELIFVKAGTLDDTSILQPQAHYWVDSKQDWVNVDAGAVTFPKNPAP